MTLRFVERAEPLTRRALDEDLPVHLAGSKAHDILAAALEDYLLDRIHGRSFLIAGHRGVGKTTVVRQALQTISPRFRKTGRAPLVVPLHGPELLTAPTEPPAEGSSMPAHALRQITLALYRSLANRAGQAVDRLAQRSDDPAGFEVALEFRRLLDNAPADLPWIDFWKHFGVLEQGLFFPLEATAESSTIEEHEVPTVPSERGGRSHREILALMSAVQAFRRVIGEEASIEERSSERRSEHDAGRSLEMVRDLSRAAIALFSGSAIGLGLYVDQATLAGLLAAATAGLGWWLPSQSRRRTESVEEHHVFIRDVSLPTLERELPILVHRLKACGLAPVFVIDELDKVHNLEGTLGSTVDRLKYLLSEQTFFCFLTDRTYFEAHQSRLRRSLYPREHTYFTEALCIVHEPRFLRAYLEDILQIEGERGVRDNQDREALIYDLLHRAEVHPGNLHRQLRRLSNADGRLDLESGEIRTRPVHRVSIAYQAAVELELAQDALRDIIAQSPELMPRILDALYYVSRCWRRGDAVLDLGAQAFATYMAECRQVERGTADPDPDPELDRWRRLARSIADTLTSFDGLRRRIDGGFGGSHRERPRTDRLTIRDAIPISGTAPGLLRQIPSDQDRYDVLIDVYGLEIEAAERSASGEADPARRRAQRLREIRSLASFDDALSEFLGVGLEFLAEDLAFLSGSPVWRNVRQAARRLEETSYEETSEQSREDEAILTAYLDMFRSRLSRLQVLLPMGLAAGRMRRETLAGRIAGLRAVTSTLAPSLASATDFDVALESLQRSLPETIVLPRPISSESSNEALDALVPWVESWASWLPSLPEAIFEPNQAERAAWALWRKRLRDYLVHDVDRVLHPDWAELLCGLDLLAPARYLGPVISAISISRWSYLHQLVFDQGAQLWFGAPSIRILGFGHRALDLLKRFADELGPAIDQGREADDLKDGADFLETTVLRRDPREEERPIVLLVSRDPDPTAATGMSTWTPSTRYAAYWTAPSIKVPQHIEALFAAHPRPRDCRVLIEAPRPGESARDARHDPVETWRSLGWPVAIVDPALDAPRGTADEVHIPMAGDLDHALDRLRELSV